MEDSKEKQAIPILQEQGQNSKDTPTGLLSLANLIKLTALFMGMKNLYCLKRSGLLAVKKGMMTLFDDCNRAIPSTVLQVDNCYALGTRKIPGFDTAVFQDVGMGPKQPKNISYPLLRYFKTCGVPPLGNVRSFKISPTAIIPQGTRLYAGHFLVGQYVDVQGISKGKGFQGVMKRWGFKGGPASHGSSKFHRRPENTRIY